MANINAQKFKNEAEQLREEIQKLENLMEQTAAEADQNMNDKIQKYKTKISELQAEL